ncbi:MAG TPA: 2OG-Fe(II) oxygenase [Methylophilaceae bacterium]|nr:2OG-Fe(II) oxygenase [Methylophilaceae bacterium]
MPNPPSSIEESIADEVAAQGYAVTPDFLSITEVAELASELRTLQQSGEMRGAGVGKDAEVTNNVRGDFIHWLEESSASPAQQVYLQRLEELRLALNQTLYLGLFEFEGHFASYPPGAFYRKHLDQFQHDSQRALSCILYLNDSWLEEDGGQLRMYLDENDDTVYRDIQPRGGTLVTFLSARYWHEVLPARRERLSITGWFRTRSPMV